MAEAGERPIDPQLSYVPVRSPEGQAYLKAMAAAANFALCNRCAGRTMLCRRCCLTRNGWSTLQGFPMPPASDPGARLPYRCRPTQYGDIDCLCGTAVLALQAQAHTLPLRLPLLPTQTRTVVMDCVRRAFEAVFGRSARKLGMRTVYDVSHNLAKVETHQG